ncbi:AraC family transcriptional regulator [bacterium]|nr:AraC family transcriptional regulator [bacterium]
MKHPRDYLMDNHVENVSPEQLSQIVGLNPFHLTRLFSAELGLPPHLFQTRVRVLQAKKLIKQGWIISNVSQATGFADQAHLTRHFKRL